MSFASTVKQSASKVEFKPHAYQSSAIKWVMDQETSGLFLPPGMGKTAIILAAFKKLKDAGLVSKLFIVAPIRVCHLVWPVELHKWADFEGLTATVLHGPKKNELLKEDTDIYCVNPDGLKWLIGQVAKGSIDIPEDAMLAVDESSNFKNARSQRFKLLKSLKSLFGRRVIATGTPAPNGFENLWPQVYILDNGKRLGKYITAFRNNFFYPSGYMGYEYKLRRGADEEIYELIDDIVLHKSRDELDMPGLTKVSIKVELPKEARAKYEEMKTELATVVDAGEVVVASNAAVMAGKLKQISNGALYDEEKNIIRVHRAKIDAVQELHESLDGQPMLIFYEYRHDLAALQEAFPNAPHIGGGVSTADAERHVSHWNAGKTPVMFLHPASAGHGLNLQSGGCHDVVFYSITWDAELYEQAIARVWRQGVKSGVTVHHIVSENTIDERIMSVVDGKLSLQNAVLEAVKK